MKLLCKSVNLENFRTILKKLISINLSLNGKETQKIGLKRSFKKIAK